MKSTDALREVAELSAAQWGMFTSAQAAARGVGRVTLARLADTGQIVRLAQGVYRDAGAPSDRFESLRAAWLSVYPKLLAEQRLGAETVTSTPVSGASAADLHGIGDLRVDRMEFTTPVRRQSQRGELRYRIRDLDPVDVTIKEGLPVTTLERTIADLVEERYDLSNVADVVRDASRQRTLEEERLVELLAPLASRNGFRSGGGAALWARLTELARIDAESAASAVAYNDVLGPLVTSRYLERYNEQIKAIVDQSAGVAVLQESARKALVPLNSRAFRQVTDAVAANARLLNQVSSSPAVQAASQLARRSDDSARALQKLPDLRSLQRTINEIINSPAYKQAMRASRNG